MDLGKRVADVSAAERHRSLDGMSVDHMLACPRCGDMFPPNRKRCHNCKTNLLPDAHEYRALDRLRSERVTSRTVIPATQTLSESPQESMVAGRLVAGTKPPTSLLDALSPRACLSPEKGKES